MTFAEFINVNVISVMNGVIIPVIFSLAFVAFIWGVFRYVFAGAGQEDLTKARDIMVWGIIVIAIMMSLWGLLRVITNTLMYGNTGSQTQMSGNAQGTFAQPEPEGFFDWMLNCFGACRATDSQSLEGDIQFGSNVAPTEDSDGGFNTIPIDGEDSDGPLNGI